MGDDRSLIEIEDDENPVVMRLARELVAAEATIARQAEALRLAERALCEGRGWLSYQADIDAHGNDNKESA